MIPEGSRSLYPQCGRKRQVLWEMLSTYWGTRGGDTDAQKCCVQNLRWPLRNKLYLEDWFSYARSHNPHLTARCSKHNYLKKNKQKNHQFRGVLVPVNSEGLRSEFMPRSSPSLPSDSPAAMFPGAAQQRTLGNQAQLGLRGKDTSWHNSPFSPSPCQQGSLPLSPPSLSSSSGRFLSSGPVPSKAGW